MKSEEFKKSERIVSKKLIEQLFSGNSSQSLAAFPLRVVFMLRKCHEDEPTAQLLISVPKRHLKHAVDRNRVKRQLREAYRLNRQLLTEHIPSNHQVALSFIWLSDDLVSSEVVTSKVRNLLKKIRAKIQDTTC